MKKLYMILFGILFLVSCSDDTGTVPETGKVGWAIGWDQNNNAVILNTADSGQTWKVQGDRAQLAGRIVQNHGRWRKLDHRSTESGRSL